MKVRYALEKEQVRSKKDYQKPVLTRLGKVSELTASGSEKNTEYISEGQCNNGHKNITDPRC
jgi:hypothetical protein